jgi:hypothetical protein
MTITTKRHPFQRLEAFSRTLQRLEAFATFALLPPILFHAPFDGSPEAATAAGRATPLCAEQLSYAPGVSGQAVRLTAAAKSRLEYALDGLPVQQRGTVSLWYKPEWPDGTEDRWRHLFGFTAPWDRQRLGSGAVFLWHYGPALRGDICDNGDSFVTARPRRPNGAWRHIAFTWDETGSALFLDGQPASNRRDNDNPLAAALKTDAPETTRAYGRRTPFSSFHVGGTREGRQADGLIDDLKIFSAPLSDTQLAALAAEHANPSPLPQKPDWPRLLHRENPYTAPAAPALNLQLLETLPLDREPPPDRFASTGNHAFGTLDGTRYLTAGTNRNDRFAVRFTLPAAGQLYCFEWLYPDDATRTADIIVQPAAGSKSNYELQVGYMTGDEYPNQNRMLTARCLYWAPTQDVAVIVMTARANAPAAVSQLRLYQVNGGLPAARISNLCAAGRTLGLYYEDPAISYDFASPGTDPAAFETLIDRTAAYMKYTGQNLFCYPGVWYHGRIGETYNPRGHAEDFLTAWYVKFDAEGLGMMPIFNQQTLPLPGGLKITKRSLSDGSLHDTCVSIWNSGMPNPGGWHGTPPNFNILHPYTQATILHDVDALLAQGAPHPSFKGFDLRLAEHCFHWLGSIRAGYNDYMIDAFTADTGIRVPVDRADPLRGKRYADWLLANAREPWVDWRCRAVAAWYKRFAARLAQARPDLRLSLTLLTPMHPARGEPFDAPHYIEQLNREAGIDTRLYADTPNIVIAQGLRPARHRAGYDRPKTELERAFLRDVFNTPAYYESLAAVNQPWLHLHDHYWEDPIGKSKPLVGRVTDPSHQSTAVGRVTDPSHQNAAVGRVTDPSHFWLREDPWRVTTLNPAGFYAMRPYVLPLRYHDLLGITRGGFLIGTYGMEDFLIPFAKAFRALPAQRFADVPGSTATLKVRTLQQNGQTWFYAVNTDDQPATLTLATAAEDVTDLVTGTRPAELNARSLTLTLAPYQLRSFLLRTPDAGVSPIIVKIKSGNE